MAGNSDTHDPVPARPLKPLKPGSDARVAVGVPVRNGAEFLEIALETLVRQTHPNLEIVVSDNASTDGTAEICKRFARRDPRIRYFRQPVALRADENFRFVFEQCARSEWFLWASHDDLRVANYVEVLLSGFRAHPDAAIVFSDTRVFSDHHRPEIANGPSWATRSSTGFPFPDRHLVVVENGPVQIYGLFRADVLRSFRWPKIPVGHDWMILHWSVTFGNVVYVPGSTFCYFVPGVPRAIGERNAYHWLRRQTWLDAIRVVP